MASIRFRNDMGKELFHRDKLVSVTNAFVTSISLNGGSSKSSSIAQVSPIKGRNSTVFDVPGNWPSEIEIDFTVGAPLQQRHVMNNVQVRIGSTVTFRYEVPDEHLAEVVYAYQLDEAPPVIIGTAVLGVDLQRGANR